MQEYGYNLQRSGWLTTFTEDKTQVMRSNEIPWRDACERHHFFFFILLATLTNKNDVIMASQCGVGMHSLLALSLL